MTGSDADGLVGPLGSRWTLYTVGRASVETVKGGIRLGTIDAIRSALADAQIDDYHGRHRGSLPWVPPLRLTVRARWSHPSAALRGTIGFGFWNDPVDGRGRFAAAPNAVWFFHASEPSRIRLRREGVGTGMVAAAMHGGEVNSWLLAAGNLALRIPGVDQLAARIGGSHMGGADTLLPEDLDITAWHDYLLDWRWDGAVFAVDGAEVARLAARDVPRCRLGFVAWIDNNWADLGDDGRYRSGCLDAPGGQWLELARVVVEGDELDIRTGGRPKR
ncbi:MAG: hypothetical protein M3R02_13560 [Chloroflexota bacterium]|nr:hypothetical protein [Chloroflexota bacterium]